MKIFKKLASLFLTVCLLLCAIPFGSISANAEAFSGTCGDNLTWNLNTVTDELIISGRGDMTNWNPFLDVPWYSEKLYIKTVIIENGVTDITHYAFSDCSSLTSVTIPERQGDSSLVY